MGNTAEFLRQTAEGKVDACQSPTCIDLERRFLFVFNEGVFNSKEGNFLWADGSILAQFFWADLYKENPAKNPSDRKLLLIKNHGLVSPKNPFDAGIGLVNGLVLTHPSITFTASLTDRGFMLGRPVRRNLAGRTDYQEHFTKAMNRYMDQLSTSSIPSWGELAA